MKLTKLFSYPYDVGGQVTRNYIRLFSTTDINKLNAYADYLVANKMYSELANLDEAVRVFGIGNYLTWLKNKVTGDTTADRINRAVAKEKERRTVGTGEAADKLNEAVRIAKQREILDHPWKSLVGWLDKKNQQRIQKKAQKEWDNDPYMDPEVLEHMGYDPTKRKDAEKAMVPKPTGSIKKLIENNNADQAVASKYRDHSDDVHPDAPYYGNDDASKIINGEWGGGKTFKRAGEYVKTKAKKARDKVSEGWNKLAGKFKKGK